MPPARSLYICYFGLREPLVQTQVLPYLRELVAGGTRMSLLTFEPRRWDAAEWRARLRAEGIEWHALPYHKRPTLPATLYDVVRGALRAAALARRERIDLIHARSHVAAAMGALAKRMSGARLIFDYRGALAEEYVDSGNWRAGGMLYRMTKAWERWLLRAADGVVFLTDMECAGHAGALTAAARPAHSTVIPCCVDLARFDVVPANIPHHPVYVYAGALGGYYLVDEMAQLVAAARAFALVLTQSAPGPMIAALEREGVPHEVKSVPPDDVPRYLRAADVALLLVRPSPARRAQSPTKFAEYMAAGLPVIATAGIGDLDAQIEQHRVGVLLRSLDRAALAAAVREMDALRRDPELPERCRALARSHYDLHDVGGARYRRPYEGGRLR